MCLCVCFVNQTHLWPTVQALPPGPSYSSRWSDSSSLQTPLRQCACVQEQSENVNNSASLSTQVFPCVLPPWTVNTRDTLLAMSLHPPLHPPFHVTLCQLQGSLILLGWGSHRGDWKVCHEYLSSSVLPLSLPSSTQAHKHTLIHTTPLWTARLSFITLVGESSRQLKINVTERRRSDSQPASSRRSEQDRRFKRSQPLIVKTRKIKNICKSAEPLFFLALFNASPSHLQLFTSKYNGSSSFDQAMLWANSNSDPFSVW